MSKNILNIAILYKGYGGTYFEKLIVNSLLDLKEKTLNIGIVRDFLLTAKKVYFEITD